MLRHHALASGCYVPAAPIAVQHGTSLLAQGLVNSSVQAGMAPTRLGMALHDGNVDALEQPVQLLHHQGRHSVSGWPDEAVLLQALEQQPVAVAVLAENLHAVASAVAEHIRAGRERIQAKRLLHQQCQAVDVQPEVDRLAVQVDLEGFVEAEHRSLPPRHLAL